MRLTLVFLFCLLAVFITCQSVTVEYPMYPPTKEGRDLKQFLNGVRTVAFALEPMNSEIWTHESNRSFVLMVPGKIYESLSQDSYFKILDLKDRPDVQEGKDLTLEGIHKNRKRIGEVLDADAILFVSVKQPESQCYVERKMDYLALGMAVLRVAAAGKDRDRQLSRAAASLVNDPIVKPTGVRKVYIPIEANLIRVDSGEMMKTTLSKPSIIYNGVGDVSCPSMLPSLSTALDESISEIQRRLSPKVESEDISIFTEDENPEVEALLLEGYEEITGDNPNFQRAKISWEKADQKAKGKSWAAKANLATYYFSEGDYQKAIQFYDEAIRLGGPEDDYLKELKELMAPPQIEEEATEK
ncbi:lipoprotein LipL41 [Leptospira haakeii]|uniref:Lipoprotein LipL41 n=1 Tax=Leptospira haakeii TaxID=2023198 RepID=A0ABX4PLW9_9LEPT|nr:lipoprotein LipL41 [Leptospira haakeii]PKA15697.1 lipoprotein LipL41 [Leptospira haakeii]PKA21783.1 lipoprotein LipL41 [Leptospira haakeii]